VTITVIAPLFCRWAAESGSQIAKEGEVITWADGRALRLFVSANFAGGTNIAKRGGRRGRHKSGATMNSHKATTDAGEYAGRQPKMREAPPKIARRTAS
jgi:hypothetical protein